MKRLDRNRGGGGGGGDGDSSGDISGDSSGEVDSGRQWQGVVGSREQVDIETGPVQRQRWR